MRNPSKALPVLLLSLLAGPTGCAQILDLPDTVECGSDDACTTNDNPCVLGECVDGTCAFTLVAEGEVVGALEAGDCQELVCDGAGTAVTAPDPTDAPADETPGDCKAPACSETGAVVESPAEDAPADETLGDCKAPVCEDGAVVDGPAEDAPTDGVTGDCSRPACDRGAVVDAANDDDAPSDEVPGDCESPTCDGGQVVVEVNPADLPPDIAGDCLAAECGAQGLVIDDMDLPTTGCGGCANGVVVPWTEAGMTCYTGDPSELSAPNTACNDGTWTCVDNAKICEGEQLPVQESCGPGTSGVDDDCNGQTDESGPGCACQLGMTQTCYEGPPGTRGVGTCTTGLSSCMATPMGNQYGECVGDTFPETCDSCLDNLDEDCAGGAATCTGSHVFSKGITNVDGVFADSVLSLPSGEVLVAGRFSGSLSSPNSITSDGNQDVALLRFDAEGNAIQAREFGGTASDANTLTFAPSSLLVQLDDGYLLAGHLGSGSGENFGSGATLTGVGLDGFLAKFNSQHTLQWKKLVGGTSDDAIIGAARMPDNGLVVAGLFQGTINLGGNNLTSAGGRDIFLARFDSGGAHVWSVRSGGASNESLSDVAASPAGAIALVGGSTVSLYSSAGALQWSRTWSSSGAAVPAHATFLSDESLWVGGTFDAAANVDTVSGNDFTPSGSGTDLLFVKYDGSGTLLAGSSINGTAQTDLSDLATGEDDAIVAGGSYTGSLFTSAFAAPAAGGYDGFVVKLRPNNGNVVWGRKPGGPVSDYLQGVALLPCGDVLVTGWALGAGWDFGGGALPYAGMGTANSAFAKYRQ